MTFIRGPVCKGQVALNVIQDHFWALFLDPDYAKQTKYGAVVYPPFAPVGVMNQGSPALAARTFGGESKKTSLLPPTPGSYFMNMSMEWEWFKPIVVGDRLTTKT